ncbi:MAG: CRTAC1 family protein [Phycisphaerales bacterium]|nr:CRTAC1 family protein [Phycisphaerales bacterium]
MVIAGLLVGCEEAGPMPEAAVDPSTPQSTLFIDVTDGSGLADVVMRSGHEPSTRIIEVKGGGLALLDLENDGDLDLFMPNGATLDSPAAGPGARLFRNLADEGKGLKFEEIKAAGDLLEHRAWSFGVAAGDVDGNGYDDLVVSTLGPNRLYLNQGDGTFQDASQAWGLATADDWSTSVALADLDGDGDLDLYVVNYLDFDPAAAGQVSRFKGTDVLAGPRGMTPLPDRIYENTGSGFTDRSDQVLGDVAPRYGLNLAVLDFDDDGMLDIYVGNDSQPNVLLRNGGGWSFEDIGVRSGTATNLEGDAQATMGIAVADVDGNGFPDIYSTNFSSDTNTLHTNIDGRFFDDRTARYGLLEGTRSLLGWASEFGDFDHDGDEDLVVFNGHVYPQATPELMDSAYEQPPGLWRRDGDRFLRVEETGLGGPRRDRTAVVADLDLDGDLDIVAGELNGPLRLYRNTHDQAQGHLLVRPIPALGTRIQLQLRGPDGESLQRRWIRGGGPFQSTAAPHAHFGFPVGSVPGDLRVTWPDGRTALVRGPRAGEVLVVTPDEADNAP